MSTDWSDTPPTEAGWYWVRNRLYGSEQPAYFRGDHWLVADWMQGCMAVERSYQFGNRIPSNEELLAMRQQIAELTAQRDAAEAELEAATQRLIDQEVA